MNSIKRCFVHIYFFSFFYSIIYGSNNSTVSPRSAQGVYLNSCASVIPRPSVSLCHNQLFGLFPAERRFPPWERVFTEGV